MSIRIARVCAPAARAALRVTLRCRAAPAGRPARRLLSGGKKEGGTQVSEADAAQDALMNAPLSVQEKASVGFWISLLGVGAVCFVFTVRELMPTAMSANYAMDEAFSQVNRLKK